MSNPFEYAKEMKCFGCVHSPVCINNLGGADLDIVCADCLNYLPTATVIQLPTKFYIVFDIPGFYDIVEYNVERVSYFKGTLDKMWGKSKHSSDVAYAADIGRTVFFDKVAAEAGLKKLIEERQNG